MTVKGYVFFAMSVEGREQLSRERPSSLPQAEGITTELLAGPYDGVFIIEVPDLHRLGEVIVDFVANNPAVRSCASCIVLRDYGPAPTPEEGG